MERCCEHGQEQAGQKNGAAKPKRHAPAAHPPRETAGHCRGHEDKREAHLTPENPGLGVSQYRRKEHPHGDPRERGDGGSVGPAPGDQEEHQPERNQGSANRGNRQKTRAFHFKVKGIGIKHVGSLDKGRESQQRNEVLRPEECRGGHDANHIAGKKRYARGDDAIQGQRCQNLEAGNRSRRFIGCGKKGIHLRLQRLGHASDHEADDQCEPGRESIETDTCCPLEVVEHDGAQVAGGPAGQHVGHHGKRIGHAAPQRRPVDSPHHFLAQPPERNERKQYVWENDGRKKTKSTPAETNDEEENEEDAQNGRAPSLRQITHRVLAGLEDGKIGDLHRLKPRRKKTESQKRPEGHSVGERLEQPLPPGS